MEAVRAGRTAEAVSLLDGMTDAERRACFPELRALRKELRADQWTAQARRACPTLHAAGTACQTGAAGVASWLAASDMRWWPASPGVLIHLLGDRAPGWLGDVVHRLAERPLSSRSAASARWLGDLLAVAAECAERTGHGAQGEIPHLAMTADRRGSSRLVAQARRLRSAPAEGVAA